ncbi:MAG: MacS family sensor histidine kinase [Actinomadura sp.]
MGFDVPLWRAVAVYRVAALGYAAVLIARNFTDYRHPAGGWVVLAVMAGWTGFAGYAFTDQARRSRWLLAADLLVAAATLLATVWIERPERIWAGAPTLPTAWVAGAVLSWAMSGGMRHGAVAAAVISAASLGVRGLSGGDFQLTQATVNGVVLLLLAGVVVGYGAELAREAEARLARAVELAAATRERERLARHIHDSVLQLLSLMRRRGGELGGEAAELGRLAGEQETALRALIGSRGAPPDPAGDADLRTLLTALASATVTVSTPAMSIRLPTRTAREVEAAVAAALDNVRRHCGDGVRAWVLLEDDADAVTVSVRDEGGGIPPGRLATAEADGRLGVAQSIRGRIRDLGGTVSITSVPGQGTEVEMSIPV